MIELSDFTLREANGDYHEVHRLMDKETTQDWMLRSEVFVSTQFIASKYILHFWKNGNVVIHGTDHPVRMDITDEDLRELSNWCKGNGWHELQIDDRMLDERVALEYWHRAFIAGLVTNASLQKREDDEMGRLMKAQQLEENDVS